MADPGFPEVRAQTLQGAPTYDFTKFSQKLYEIERSWTRSSYISHYISKSEVSVLPAGCWVIFLFLRQNDPSRF